VICGIPIHPTQQVKTMRLTKTIPLILLLAAQGLAAQTWPDKPVRFILPVTPGGATDVVARIVTNDLSKSLGQPVVIEHRPGADGIVGAQSVARAAPDGYTLIVALSSFTTAPYQQPTMPYDPAADFAAITEIATQPMVLLANPNIGVKTIAQLLALARSKPQGINGSQAGGAGQLAMEVFKRRGGVEKNIVTVAYKGGAQSMAAVMSGEVQFAFVGGATALPYIKGGKLLLIATAGSQRSASFPDVPTLAESGVPGMDVTAWQGLLAPAGTPRPIITRLHTEIAAGVRRPESMERLLVTGSEPVLSTPEQFGAKIKRQMEEYGPIIRSITPG
jgi:tripartite-type tricarboxylate transporter receptor subunit TctC